MFRSRRLLLGLVVLLVALAGMPSTAAAQTPIPNPVDIIGGGDKDKEKDKNKDDEKGNDRCPVLGVSCAPQQIVDIPEDAAGDAVANAGESVMQGVTSWVANGASWLLRQVADLAEKTTTPRLDSKWFGDRYADMMVLSVPLVAILLMLSMIEAALRRDPSQVARSFVALPIAFILAGGILVVLGLLITATDAWSAWLLRRFDNDAREVYKGLATASIFSGLTGRLEVPLFIVFLSALVTALCTIGVWIELLLREAAIYVAAFFIPLCYAGAVWRRSEPWVQRSTEFIVAVILAKLPIAGALALGAAAMAHSGEDGGAAAVGGVLAGAAVIGFAALSPWLLLRMFPLARDAMGAGMHQRAALPAGSTMVRAASPATAMKSAMAANWAAGAVGGLAVAGAAAAASKVGRSRGDDGGDEPRRSGGPRGGDQGWQERREDPASRLRGDMAKESTGREARQGQGQPGKRGAPGAQTGSQVAGLPPKDQPPDTGLGPPPPPPPRPPQDPRPGTNDPSRRST